VTSDLQNDPQKALLRPSTGRLPGRSACLRCDANAALNQTLPAAPIHDIVGSIVGRDCFRGLRARPGQRFRVQNRCQNGPKSLDVVVEVKLVRVRAEGDGIDFALALVGDPLVDHVVGEDAAFDQELVVCL
jgi:hypothetical protein